MIDKEILEEYQECFTSLNALKTELKTKKDFTLGHGETSVYLALQHLELTELEAMMIRWHMGPYDNGDFLRHQNITSKYPEILLFHMADNFASHFIDTQYEVQQ